MTFTNNKQLIENINKYAFNLFLFVFIIFIMIVLYQIIYSQINIDEIQEKSDYIYYDKLKENEKSTKNEKRNENKVEIAKNIPDTILFIKDIQNENEYIIKDDLIDINNNLTFLNTIYNRDKLKNYSKNSKNSIKLNNPNVKKQKLVSFKSENIEKSENVKRKFYSNENKSILKKESEFYYENFRGNSNENKSSFKSFNEYVEYLANLSFLTKIKNSYEIIEICSNSNSFCIKSEETYFNSYISNEDEEKIKLVS